MNNIKGRSGDELVGFRRTQLQQMRRVERKARTEGNQGERQERQTMQLRAKAHLFQEAEVHNQKQVTRSYSNSKNARQAKRHYFTLVEQPITAFEDNIDSLRRQQTQPQPTTNAIKSRIERTHTSQLPNHEFYWNRKHHPQIMVLRPAILNPTITVQLNEDSNLQSSPKAKYLQPFHQIQSRKDFQAAIREYAKKTKEIYNNHDVSRVRVQERNRKVISISKRLAKLKSKSTSFIHEEQHRNQIISQLEKLTARCEFDIQIKPLNSQKQEIANHRSKEKSNELQLKIRNLITREKSKIRVVNQQQVEGEKEKINEQVKMEKLLQIHKRSKSCVASSFKGSENKKLKIATILSKLVKFKAEEDQRKRQRQEELSEVDRSLEFVRFNMSTTEQKIEKQPLLRIQQEQLQSQSMKKALLSSIKKFCKDNKNGHLPFVRSFTKNSPAP